MFSKCQPHLLSLIALCLSAAAGLSVSSPSGAQQPPPTMSVSRVDELPLSLGLGYDPAYASVLNSPFAKSHDVRAPGQGAKIDGSMEIINSWQQLYQNLTFDAKASARWRFLNLNMSSKLAEERQISANSFVWMVRLNCDYGWWDLDDRSFTDEAAALKSRPADFARRYGTYLVTAEHRGALLTATFSIEGVSDSQRRDIAATLNVSGGHLFGASYTLDASFDQAMQSLQKRYSVKCTIRAYGGPGLNGSIGGIIVSGDWETTKNGIAAYVTLMSVDQARTIAYHLQHVRTFGVTAPLFDDSKEARLAAAYENYKSAETYRDKLKDIVDNATEKYNWVLPSDLIACRRMLPVYENYLVTITRAGRELAAGKDVVVSALPALLSPIPAANLWIDPFFWKPTDWVHFNVRVGRVDGSKVYVYVCREANGHLEQIADNWYPWSVNDPRMLQWIKYDPIAGTLAWTGRIRDVGATFPTNIYYILFDEHMNELSRYRLSDAAL